MPSNPQNLIRSWNTQANFSNGRVVMDRLTPPAFTRIRTPFVLTWREDNAVVNNLDWGAKSFSVYLPESLRVVQGIYLKIECPATTGANFKDYSGLQVIKSIRVLSGGTEAYVADVEKYLVDYCQSLTEEQLKEFARIHLGGSTSPGGADLHSADSSAEQSLHAPQRARHARVWCLPMLPGIQPFGDPDYP